MGSVLCTLISSLLVAGLASSASAATPTYIQGALVDSAKSPIAGVTVSAIGPNGFSGESVSDAAGKWKIEVPAAAVYEVSINQEQLPSGQALTDAAKATIKANVISLGFDVTILFPIGPGVEKTTDLERSHMGKASRAVADNPALASSSGIEVERVIRAVWILGATLASFAGIMVTVNQGVSFVMGQDLLLLIFAAVTLGGLGTINGALVGSVVIGVSIQLSTLFIPTELKYVGALVILILILLVRPQGILGKKGRIG